jgi:hypothetical protein
LIFQEDFEELISENLSKVLASVDKAILKNDFEKWRKKRLYCGVSDPSIKFPIYIRYIMYSNIEEFDNFKLK